MKIGKSGWIGSALVCAVLGCSGGSDKTIVIAPEYQAEYAVVFDDLLAPELFGFDPEGRNPVNDPRLRERTLRADLVLPARVETISRVGGVENKGAYELVITATGPALHGTAPAESIIVNIGAGSASYPWVEGAGARWVGTRLILFAKRFQGSGRDKGDAGANAGGANDVLHYRGEPDTPEMRAAILRHLASRVLRKP